MYRYIAAFVLFVLSSSTLGCLPTEDDYFEDKPKHELKVEILEAQQTPSDEPYNAVFVKVITSDTPLAQPSTKTSLHTFDDTLRVLPVGAQTTVICIEYEDDGYGHAYLFRCLQKGSVEYSNPTATPY